MKTCKLVLIIMYDMVNINRFMINHGLYEARFTNC